MKVLIATSVVDFDPTEVAVPWKTLSEAGHEVHFATDTGAQGRADARMPGDNGLGTRRFQTRTVVRARDTPEHLSRGFAVRDRNDLSARWPGDVHRFSRDFLDMLG